jgi:hypothetical protein
MENKIETLLTWLDGQRKNNRMLAKLAITKRSKAVFTGAEFAYERVIKYIREELEDV